jgi:hypothetical protein
MMGGGFIAVAMLGIYISREELVEGLRNIEVVERIVRVCG